MNLANIIDAPSTLVDADVKNLLNMQKENLTHANELISIENAKNIPENVKQINIDSIKKNYDISVNLINQQIQSIKDKKSKLNTDEFIKNANDKKTLELSNAQKQDKTYSTKVISALKVIPVDLSSTLSNFTTKLLSSISLNNSDIEILVDKTNEIILSIKTQQDVNNAIILRNNALKIIADSRNKIQDVQRIVNIIETILTIIPPILIFLQANPLPLMFSTAGVVDTFEKYRSKLESLSISLTIILGIVDQLLTNMVLDLNYQESRLEQIGNILDSNIESLSESDIKNMLDSSLGLGLVKDITYKGFVFFIKEESDLTHEVKGFKRRYATAVNKDGNDVLVSAYSYTKDPLVLIEELKINIDKNNLQG